jgi:hypothetical protein
MNILLTAHRFFPDVGGTEPATESMAQEFSEASHKVMVVTQTPGEPIPTALYELVRASQRSKAVATLPMVRCRVATNSGLKDLLAVAINQKTLGGHSQGLDGSRQRAARLVETATAAIC